MGETGEGAEATMDKGGWAGPRLGQRQDCFLMSIYCPCVRTSEDGLGGPSAPFFVLLSDVATLINLFFFYFHY